MRTDLLDIWPSLHQRQVGTAERLLWPILLGQFSTRCAGTREDIYLNDRVSTQAYTAWIRDDHIPACVQ